MEELVASLPEEIRGAVRISEAETSTPTAVTEVNNTTAMRATVNQNGTITELMEYANYEVVVVPIRNVG